ncbi:MAG TPA: chemotaxis protein CheW [Thermoanaerobaculia bacterium]|jgi:purine-binding chemotaxis protein CheW|nr:chemotaxis protein CheW [Thermoanaerobaculia bacterium]
MVDLAKIRKKAKAAGRGSGAASRESEQAPAPASEPAVIVAPEPASAPTPDPRLPTPASAKLEQFKQIAGKRREGFIEQKAEAVSADQVELLSFVIAGEQYAVLIDHVVEIVTPRDATRVPNADPTIVGIISLRGTIVTIIDIRRKLRHPPSEAGNETRIIVAERGGETLGFEVDRVLRVLKVESAAIEPHPVVHSSELSEAVRGVFRYANALTILLDLDKLLA